MRPALRAAIPAVLLAALALVPFLGKAYTIDDTLFLFQARHLMVDPLHPTAFFGTFSFAPERMSSVTASGPMMAYLLVPCIALGGAEWAAHGVQLILFATALWATASLALRFGAGERAARWSALVLAASPAALAMAGTAMPDVPAMAFGVLGVERALAWAQEKKTHQAVSGSIALSLAALSRSHLVLLLGVAVLAAVPDFLRRESWSRLRGRAFLPLAACPALIGAALLITRDPDASAMAMVGTANRFVHAETIRGNLLAFLAHWVLTLPFAVPWIALHPRRIFVSPVVYLATLVAWIALRHAPGGSPLLAAGIVGLGAAAILDLLNDARRRSDSVQMLLGLWILVPIVIVPYLHLPSKYLLAAAPAAALAVARAAETATLGRRRVILSASIALGVTLGILILRADAVFAGLGRKAAQELIQGRAASGSTVWFDGHWGFQWYAEKAGAVPVSTQPPYPDAGDLIVTSALTGLGFLEAVPHRRLVGVVTEERPGGRVMCREAGAGFYSNDFGIWPWRWAAVPVDRYELWSIGNPEPSAASRP